jgi:hypothetical protein
MSAANGLRFEFGCTQPRLRLHTISPPSSMCFVQWNDVRYWAGHEMPGRLALGKTLHIGDEALRLR